MSQEFTGAFKFSNGKYDPYRVAVLLVGVLMVSLLVGYNISEHNRTDPTFEFLNKKARAVNPVVAPGDDLIIELEISSQNLPGYTQIFGQFDCSEGFRVEAEQYRNFSLIAGGGEPFQTTVTWRVKVPEGAPEGPCVYTHAAVLFNDNIDVVTSNFIVGSGQNEHFNFIPSGWSFGTSVLALSSKE